MRRLAWAAWLVTSAYGAACPAGYGYGIPIKILGTKVGTGTQTNFAHLICFNGSAPCNGAMTALKVVGSGGLVQHTVTSTVPYSHTVAADLVFTDGSATLPVEQERYVGTTGELVAWVQKTVVGGTDTLIWMCVGNSAISTDQQNVTGVWDVAAAGTWHMPDGSSLSAVDSTVNSNTGTITGATAAAGKIDGGASFTAGQEIDFGTGASLAPTAGVTLVVWANVSAQTGNYRNLLFKHIANGSTQNNSGYALWETASGAAGPFRFDIGDGTTGHLVYANSGAVSAGWHQVAGTFDGSTLRIYVDGVAQTPTTSYSGTISYASTTNLTAAINPSNSSENFAGGLDEIRVSAGARSAGWIATMYANQISPATYYTAGSPIPVRTAPVNIVEAPGADYIRVIQEREAHERAVAARIEYQLSKAPKPVAAPAAAPRKLSDAEVKELHEALDRYFRENRGRVPILWTPPSR